MPFKCTKGLGRWKEERLFTTELLRVGRLDSEEIPIPEDIGNSPLLALTSLEDINLVNERG